MSRHGVIASWRKGQKVAVTINSRGKYEAVQNYGESVAPSTFQPSSCAPSTFQPFVLPGIVAPQAVPVATVTPVRAFSVPPSVTNQASTMPETKRLPYAQNAEMLNYSQDMAKLYHCIFNQVCEQFSDLLLKDELLKDISTTLFIQTNRRFNT
jgi:hypothetical protein